MAIVRTLFLLSAILIGIFVILGAFTGNKIWYRRAKRLAAVLVLSVVGFLAVVMLSRHF